MFCSPGWLQTFNPPASPYHSWFLSDLFFEPWVCKVPDFSVIKCGPAYVASEAPGAWTISSHLGGLFPSLTHTLLLADVRWCRGGVWTAEMFVEWRKLGDAMWGLTGLVMLEKDQEAGEHEAFLGRGLQGSEHAEFQ